MKILLSTLQHAAVWIIVLNLFNFSLGMMNVSSNLIVTLGALVFTVASVITILYLRANFTKLYRHYHKSGAATALSVIAICAVSLSSMGCNTVIPPGHVAIVVHQTGSDRGVQNIPTQAGRVFYNPWNENVLDYPTYVQRAIWTQSPSEGKKGKDGSSPNEEITFQSADSLHFTVDVAVAYQLLDNSVPAFYVKFRSDDLETFTHGFFRDATRKAIGQAAQKYTQEEVNGGKQADLERDAQSNLAEAVKPYGVVIVQLAFTSPPRPPDQVRDAVANKVAATQRAEQVENEKRQAIAEGAKTVALATAEADANRLLSNSITPALLQKLYIEKWNGQPPMVSGGNSPLIMQMPTGK